MFLQAGYVGEDVESILYKLLAVCELFCRTMMLLKQIINSLFSRNEPFFELPKGSCIRGLHLTAKAFIRVDSVNFPYISFLKLFRI